MSAFVVTKHHIDVIVTGATALLPSLKAAYGSATGIGDVLWAENVRSVVHCYPSIRDTDEARAYEEAVSGYRFAPAGDVPAGALARAVDCLEYQSSECEDWPWRDACALVRRIRDELIRTLPGYDQAPGGYEDPT